MSKVITWDWKGNIDIGQLQEALIEFGVSIFEIETNSDQFAIVIGNASMTQEKANIEYEKRFMR